MGCYRFVVLVSSLRHTGNDAGTHVHAHLHGMAEIQRNDVLQVRVRGQRLRIGGTLRLNSLQAMSQ